MDFSLDVTPQGAERLTVAEARALAEPLAEPRDLLDQVAERPYRDVAELAARDRALSKLSKLSSRATGLPND